MHEREQSEWPLWMLVGGRLLCGAIGVGVFWLLGRSWGTPSETQHRMIFGLVCGLLFGERFLKGMWGAAFWR